MSWSMLLPSLLPQQLQVLETVVELEFLTDVYLPYLSVGGFLWY